MDKIEELLRRSNSENNVTAQIFAPLVQTLEGRGALGRWLSGRDDALVQWATFFWFPLRDVIANALYEGDAGAGRWRGYPALFAALNLPEGKIESLPNGHPKNPAWGPYRARAEVEIVAELASSEIDAAFVVSAAGSRRLYLVEAKWLSGLGAPRVGKAGFALNQIQRGVALAAWLRKVDAETPVTYMLCAVSHATTIPPDPGTALPAACIMNHIMAGASESAPHRRVLEHLRSLVVSGEIRTAARTWRGLAEGLRTDPALASVVCFLHEHGQGRRYRRRSAALIPSEEFAPTFGETLNLGCLSASAVLTAVREQGKSFRTKDVSRHPGMVAGHPGIIAARLYHALVGRYLAAHSAELAIEVAARDRNPNGTQWTRTRQDDT